MFLFIGNYIGISMSRIREQNLLVYFCDFRNWKFYEAIATSPRRSQLRIFSRKVSWWIVFVVSAPMPGNISKRRRFLLSVILKYGMLMVLTLFERTLWCNGNHGNSNKNVCTPIIRIVLLVGAPAVISFLAELAVRSKTLSWMIGETDLLPHNESTGSQYTRVGIFESWN